MTVYLDTSVILRKLLGGSGALREWGHWGAACTSEITKVEALRSFERLRLEGKLDDAEVARLRQLLGAVLEASSVITLNAAVLEKASLSFPTVVGTLDAIHLASASLFIESRKDELAFLTHDRQLGTAARAIGLATRGWE